LGEGIGGVGVVDEDPDPTRGTDPLAIDVAESGVNEIEHIGIELGQQILDRSERCGVLGKKDVRLRGLAFRDEGGSQLRRPSIPDFDLDPCLFGEFVEQRLDQLFAPSRVDDKRPFGIAFVRTSSREYEGTSGPQCNESIHSYLHKR
jgi:hypothetical protein